MTSRKTVLAALASAGLLAAQPAAAAVGDRTGSTVADSEDLAGAGLPSAALPFLIALLVAAVVVIIDTSGDDDFPVSP